MKITIHRGINQIGGCITEISTDKANILIDLGQNLPDGEGNFDDNFANEKTISDLTKNIDAIFYTHYHGDHVGLFNLVPDNVKQYIGIVAKEVMLTKHTHLSKAPTIKEQETHNIAIIKKMIGYKATEKIKIKDITIIPYFVSHSAADANMFVIEADGKRILHTGDFREHGYLSKGLIPTLKKYILSKGKIDFLITEGTMLSRMDEEVITENELKQKVKDVMKEYKNVFIMSSSTDMERLASFYAANEETTNGKRYFVCDNFQEKILNVFTKTSGEKSYLFKFKNLLTIYNDKNFNEEVRSKIKNDGITMMVRASHKSKKFINYYNKLKPILKEKDTIIIYSMWSQYVNPKSKHLNTDYYNFFHMFPNRTEIHTSGHASPQILAQVCNLVNPSLGIIPIHSEYSGNFKKLDINDDLKQRIISKSQIVNDVSIKLNIEFN